MRSVIRCLTVVLVTAGISAVALAPVVGATPQCTNTGPNTTLCQTNGSSQIVTTPGPTNVYGPWPPYWGSGIVIGFGGINITF